MSCLSVSELPTSERAAMQPTNVIGLYTVAHRLRKRDGVASQVLVRCQSLRLSTADTQTAIRSAQRAYDNHASPAMAVGIGCKVAYHLAAERDSGPFAA
jgi:hypothetical protein